MNVLFFLLSLLNFATALTSDGQLRREPAISGTPENKIFR